MEPQPPPPNQETIFEEQDFIQQGYDKHLRQARNAIFVVAGVQFVFGLILGFQAPEEERFVSIAFLTIISLIFLGLGLWANKKPYTAILIALIFYGLLLVIDAIYDPSTIYRGIIFKAIIIFYLFRGLNNAREAQHMKELLRKDEQ